MLTDTKTPMMPTPSHPAPAPPAYMGEQPSQWSQSYQPQPEWKPAAQPPQQMVSAAEIGAQYRSAQFAQCAQGNHVREKKFGVCGIITAVLLFPIGLICLFIDTEDICTRCGNKL